MTRNNRESGAMTLVMGFSVLVLSITGLLVAAVVAQQQKTTDVTRENIVDDVSQAVLSDAINHIERTSSQTVTLVPDGLCRSGTEHDVPWEWCTVARDEPTDFKGAGLDINITLQMPNGTRYFTGHLSGGTTYLDNAPVGGNFRADPFFNGWVRPNIFNRDLGFVADHRIHNLGTGSTMQSYTAGTGAPTAGTPMAASGAYLQVPSPRFVQLSGQAPSGDNFPLGTPEGEFACEGPGCAATKFDKASWTLRGVTSTIAQWTGSPAIDGFANCANPKVFQTSKAPGATLAIPASGFACYTHLIFDADTTITGTGTIFVGGFQSSAAINTAGTVNVGTNVKVNASTTWPDASKVTIATAGDIVLAPGSKTAASLVGEAILAEGATIYGSAYGGDIYANGATLYWQRELAESPTFNTQWMTWDDTKFRWVLLQADATVTDFREVRNAP